MNKLNTRKTKGKDDLDSSRTSSSVDVALACYLSNMAAEKKKAQAYKKLTNFVLHYREFLLRQEHSE